MEHINDWTLNCRNIAWIFSRILPRPANGTNNISNLETWLLRRYKSGLFTNNNGHTIIIVTLILLSYLSQNSNILGLISIIGGFYLTYLAYESFKTRGIEENFEVEEPKSFLKGAT